MKSILESIRENIINECGGNGGGGGCGGSYVSYGSSSSLSYFDKSVGNDFISKSSAEYLQELIVYIADEGKVSRRLKKDSSKQRQQDLIDLCKDIKKKMKW